MAGGNPELKLPDHIVTREGNLFIVTDRKTHDQVTGNIPTEVKVVLKRSKARYLGAAGAFIFIVYFSVLLLEGPGFSQLHVLGVSVLPLLPFVLDQVVGGLANILSYIVIYVSFAVASGLPRMGPAKLGIIFFSGGPSPSTPYSIVPASEVFGCILLGLVPFLLFKALGQVVVSYLLLIQTTVGEYVLTLRHKSMVDDALRFLESGPGKGSSDPGESHTSI